MPRIRAIMRDAYLEGADLKGADLRDADLVGAYLRGADLSGADLSGADLRYANLRDAYLVGAYLRYANLRGADLSNAYLSGADLSGADLSGADLVDASLRRANLKGTVLDPMAPLPPITDQEITKAGLEIKGHLVYGWRTETSAHVGSTRYSPGRCYRAQVFSVDTETDCHPGIYIASLEYLKREYPVHKPVKCFCRRDELIHAMDKWRCKRLWVARAMNLTVKNHPVHGVIHCQGLGADLSGADLSGADLEGADLRDTDLRDADLEGADLIDANLSGACLIGACLEGTCLDPKAPLP